MLILDQREQPGSPAKSGDPASNVLGTARARGAFTIRSLFDPPWSWLVEDRSPLTLLALTAGSAWLVFAGDERVELFAGDAAVIRDCGPYIVAHHPDEPPAYVIEAGPRCRTKHREDVPDKMHLGVRTWGSSRTASMRMLTASYQMQSHLGRRLLRWLPDLLVVRGGADSEVVRLLDLELSVDGPGQQALLDRMVDLTLVSQLRHAWSSGAGDELDRWGVAYGDPVVGPVLRAVEDNPADAWTVARLAHHVGASRATLARRFVDLVGEPPIAFLTNLRLSLAAELLIEDEATVGSVARQVGYSTPYALSTAFKRELGVSPSEHRNLARAG